MSTNLRTIAQAAGVSVSTVSRVLRGKPGVSAKSTRAVHVALGALGMSVPEAPLGRSRLIAVVQAGLSGSDVDPFGTLHQELRRRIFTVGAVALEVTASPELPSPAESLRELGVRGAVVLGGGAANPEAHRLAALRIPLLRVSNARHEGAGQIVLDASRGIDTAVRHLVHLGHRRLGLSLPQDSAADSRIAAFRRSIADVLHIPATRDQAPVVTAGPGMWGGEQAAEALVNQNCSAIISCAPALTYGVLEAAARMGLDVPRNLSVLTVGDMPDAEVIAPPLSQVTFDWQAIAQTALNELDRLIAGNTVLPDYPVTPELVLRASAKPVAKR